MHRDDRFAALNTEPQIRDCFGTVCECRRGQESLYSSLQGTDHMVYQSADGAITSATEPPRPASTSLLGKSLIGGHGHLCGAFFHSPTTYEAGNPQLCLGEACKLGPNVVLVVRVDELGGDGEGEGEGEAAGDELGGAGANTNAAANPVFVARYTNCYRGYENTVHAEQFMIRDERLRAALERANGGGGGGGGGGGSSGGTGARKRLTCYITQQPCHFSSGREENKDVTANTSCTLRVLRWCREVLRPLRVDLVIKLSRIFRATWEDASYFEDDEQLEVFGSRSVNAKKGLVMLVNEPGVRVTMFDVDDWGFLLSLCDAYVSQGKGDGTPAPCAPAVIAERVKWDKYFVDFLLKLEKKKKGGGGDGGGGGDDGGGGAAEGDGSGVAAAAASPASADDATATAAQARPAVALPPPGGWRRHRQREAAAAAAGDD